MTSSQAFCLGFLVRASVSRRQQLICNDLPLFVFLGPEQGESSGMLAGGPQAEEGGVEVAVCLPLRIRQRIVGMLRRFPVAQKQFGEVIGDSNHGVGTLTLVPHHLKVFVLWLHWFQGFAQMLNRTNVLTDAGHCAAEISGVVGGRGWRGPVGWKVSQDAVVRS